MYQPNERYKPYDQQEMEKATREAINQLNGVQENSKFDSKFLFTATFEVRTADEPRLRKIKLLAMNLVEASKLAMEFLRYWDKEVYQYEYGADLISVVHEKEEIYFKE